MTGRRTSMQAYRSHRDGGALKRCSSRPTPVRSALYDPSSRHSWPASTARRSTRPAQRAPLIASTIARAAR